MPAADPRPPADDASAGAHPHPGIRARARQGWHWLTGWLQCAGRAVRPGALAWRGASWGMLIVAGAAFLASAVGILWPSPNLLKLAAVAILLVLAVLAGAGLVGLVRLLGDLPRGFQWSLLLAAAVLGLLLDNIDAMLVRLGLVGGVLVAAALAGAGLSVVVRRWSVAMPVQRIVAAGGLLLGGGTLLAGFGWLVWAGPEAERVVDAAAQGTPLMMTAPDPSQPGPYPVEHLTYGSGEDRHRAAYGPDADLITEPVDGSPFIDGWEGAAGWARTRYWGFDAEQLPLQGRVWYPAGEGPFPLVLIVHGNHAMEDFSDPGYAYLGELLASRGMITVSVDENFLNGSAIDLLGGFEGGLEGENDARGWLLLEHLRQWRTWNETPGHRFAGMVDLGRIALIGHSRGGEAVAVAAAVNALPAYPDDATVDFGYGFGIRSVVAIAPVDGQYWPSGVETRLTDVNYFVLHGAYDGDVRSFMGASLYERVAFTGEAYRFKSALYILGANHGQFNTVWGRTDASEPFARFLNLVPLLPGDAQRQIARVYVAAFLEATLRDALSYLPLFRDARAGAAWLPETIYLTRFEDPRHTYLATFEEDLDVTTATWPDARITGEGLTVWREERVRMKWDDRLTKAVVLGWDQEAAADTARYTLALPDTGWALPPDGALVLTLADADEDPNPTGVYEADSLAADATDERDAAAAGSLDDADEAYNDEAEGYDADDLPPFIDLTIEVIDGEERAVRVPLSTFAALQPALYTQVVKADLLDDEAASEIVFQRFELSAAVFREAQPALDLSRITRITLRFDRTLAGVVILDDVGWWSPPR